MKRVTLILMLTASMATADDFIHYYPNISPGSVAATVPFVFPHVGNSDIWRTSGDGAFGNYILNVSDTVFAGDPTRPDRVYALGYNVTRAVIAEPKLGLTFESYYHDGSAPKMELYFEYISADGGTVRRPFFVSINRTTKTVDSVTFRANSFDFLNDAGSEIFAFGNGTAITSPQPFYISTNNVAALQQKNGAGDRVLNLFTVGTTDKLLVGQDTVVTAIETHAPLNFYRQDVVISDSGGAGRAAATVTPNQSYIKLNCQDADGCDITMSESGAVYGRLVVITNSSANACYFADTSGVTELAGAFAMGQYDSLTLIYDDTRWTEISRSDN